MNKFSATILGEPASKSNSRRLVWGRGRPRVIKSAKACQYLAAFKKQARPLKVLLDGDLKISIHVYYATKRPDLDCSLILDALQGIAYTNDRQIKEQHFYHNIDKANPRAEISVEEIC